MKPKVTYVENALDLFEQDLLPAGAAEYPLDLLAPGAARRNGFTHVVPAAGLRPQRFVDGDYVVVPTYLTEAEADDRGSAFSGMLAKLNADAEQVILSAVEEGHAAESVDAAIGAVRRDEVKVWVGSGMAVAVAASNVCVMPVRRPQMTYQLPDGKWACGMVAGLCVLDSRRVAWVKT